MRREQKKAVCVLCCVVLCCVKVGEAVDKICSRMEQYWLNVIGKKISRDWSRRGRLEKGSGEG